MVRHSGIAGIFHIIQMLRLIVWRDTGKVFLKRPVAMLGTHIEQVRSPSSSEAVEGLGDVSHEPQAEDCSLPPQSLFVLAE